MDRILVPAAFPDTSDAATELALTIAAKTGASVTILHVWSVPNMVAGEVVQDGPSGRTITVEQLVHERAVQLLGDYVDGIDPPRGVAIERVLREGDAKRVIPDTADAWNCDLIVMGTHGRTGFSHMVLGSVAEAVVRKSKCPVITVRG